MSDSNPANQRAAIDELAALLHMARFMSSQIPGLVPNHLRLSEQLETLESGAGVGARAGKNPYGLRKTPRPSALIWSPLRQLCGAQGMVYTFP